MVQIEITEQAFTQLKHWASVGRTIDAAVELLLLAHAGEPLDQESAMYIADELADLKYALDDCNRACKK
jgi:hypothetical protein